ncbi:hypothetical protein PG988_015479 [Apiospora saccharicola]
MEGPPLVPLNLHQRHRPLSEGYVDLLIGVQPVGRWDEALQALKPRERCLDGLELVDPDQLRVHVGDEDQVGQRPAVPVPEQELDHLRDRGSIRGHDPAGEGPEAARAAGQQRFRVRPGEFAVFDAQGSDVVQAERARHAVAAGDGEFSQVGRQLEDVGVVGQVEIVVVVAQRQAHIQVAQLGHAACVRVHAGQEALRTLDLSAQDQCLKRVRLGYD